MFDDVGALELLAVLVGLAVDELEDEFVDVAELGGGGLDVDPFAPPEHPDRASANVNATATAPYLSRVAFLAPIDDLLQPAP
ncbi:hypothetical protein G9U51_03680 [Calidifontibacter sp. DB0510]|uniref:Uncharacterized protein n=1 Tax=Metallococcus carri TaxID=1656884 RepID=A0A967AXM6_9MICO|nr:hypothetical protein [Metallococcus carri]NHN54884.1 hypothetical protein [Metallococcus carri]NOP37229.1 hypothetical protein [Calidifontibacter sp. DB2511S]